MQEPYREVYDLVDIKERLEFPQLLVKAKGFSSLVEQLMSRRLEAKKDAEYRKVLFNCFSDYGDVALELMLDVLPTLQERHFYYSELVSRHVILDEFMIRLDRVNKDRLHRAVPSILNSCLPSFSKFLELAGRIDPEILSDMFLEEELQADHYRYIIVLLYSGLLNDEQLRRLGNLKLVQEIFLQHYPRLYPIDDRKKFDSEHFLRACSGVDLVKDSLVHLDFFQRLHLMHERPSVIRNPHLSRSIVYTPFMFLICQYVPQVSKIIQGQYAHHMTYIRSQFDECVAQTNFPVPDLNGNDWTMEKMLSHVILNKSAEHFYRFVEHCADDLPMFKKSHYLPALLALLPHNTSNQLLQKKIVYLVIEFMKSQPADAEEFVDFFIGVYSQNYFPMSKKMILEAFIEMAVDRFALTPIVGFLSYEMTKGHDRAGGARCMAAIIKKFPGAVKKAAPHVKVEIDYPEDVFRETMNLAKECCLATDDHEEILGQIEGYIKDNGYRLAATMEAAIDLSKNDILDVWTCKRILGRNVKYLGNEEACAAYCRLLAAGAHLDIEDCAEELEERKKQFITDLYEFTKSHNAGVASEAWDSLGAFDLADLQQYLSLIPSQFAEIYKNLEAPHRPGFVGFLNKHLEVEKESYQRPLYNAGADVIDVPPLLAKVDTYKDLLSNKFKDEPWFWTSTLPLASSILQLTSPSNKAQTAVRILKSCLLNVPPPTSPEEAMRLVASWRICIREALNALSESKSNDILWARDQICQEGRLSLTQKSESVDNIMIMVTVLAESIEEKLKMSDDQKFVDEVSTAQKPWLISILEFCATRLPKEHKEAWIVKANPIYQVKTHSNQSSLHTAMFCCRLLCRISALTEYYRDLKDPGFGKDSYLPYLLQDSSKPLDKDLVVSRFMIYVIAEAYGASELTARAFEANHQDTVDEITGEYEAPSLECSTDIDLFFSQLLKMPRSQLIQAQQTNKKALEKIWNTAGEEVKMKIYQGLADLALISGPGRKRAVVPIEKLSDGSVLKGVLQLFDEKLNTRKDALQPLLRTFANHKRTDGRFLPPIDWMKILERADWKRTNPETRLSLIKLACEQHIPDVMFHFAADDLTPQQVYLIAENLKNVIKLVPRKELQIILRRMTMQARIVDEEKANVDKIANAIADHEKDPIVHRFLIHDLPNLNEPIQVTDPILKALKDPTAFIGLISRSFDVWAEAHNGDKMNMKRICDYILAEDNTLTETKMYTLLSLEARKLPQGKKIDKILDVITASRIQRAANGEMHKYFPIVLALVVSMDKSVEIPMCFFNSEAQAIQIMCAAKRPFFRSLLKCPQMKDDCSHIGSFLRPYVDGEETELYPLWQKTTAADMIRDLIAHFGSTALENLLHENDFFWQSILPVE